MTSTGLLKIRSWPRRPELSKIVEGKGDWMFYGHSDAAQTREENWWLIDLKAFRATLTRVDAEAAFDFFVTTYGVKYDKAVGKLNKNRDVLLVFYDFPAEHWKHVRTTNPIESTFAMVRHRTGKTKGCLSRKTGLAMAFKLMMSAQTRWRKLDGANRMPEIIEGIAFKDGVKQLNQAA